MKGFSMTVFSKKNLVLFLSLFLCSGTIFSMEFYYNPSEDFKKIIEATPHESLCLLYDAHEHNLIRFEGEKKSDDTEFTKIRTLSPQLLSYMEIDKTDLTQKIIDKKIIDKKEEAKKANRKGLTYLGIAMATILATAATNYYFKDNLQPLLKRILNLCGGAVAWYSSSIGASFYRKAANSRKQLDRISRMKDFYQETINSYNIKNNLLIVEKDNSTHDSDHDEDNENEDWPTEDDNTENLDDAEINTQGKSVSSEAD